MRLANSSKKWLKGVAQIIRSTFDVLGERTERGVARSFFYLRCMFRYSDILFRKFEKPIEGSAKYQKGVFRSINNSTSLSVLEGILVLLFRLTKRPILRILCLSLLVIGLAGYGYLTRLRSGASLFVGMALLFASAYVMISSRLNPFYAIVRSWVIFPKIIKLVPLAFVALLFSSAASSVPSYMPPQTLANLGNMAFPLILGLNALQYFAIPFVIFQIIPHLTFYKTFCRDNLLSMKRLSLIFLLTLVLASSVLFLRVLQAVPLPVYRDWPLARQVPLIGQYSTLALFAFVIPALATLRQEPLRRAFNMALRSLIALALSFAILNLPVLIFGVLFNVIRAAVPYHSLLWWSLSSLEISLQAAAVLASTIAICQMYLWQTERNGAANDIS